MRQRSAFSILVLGIALAAGCAKKPDDASLVSHIQSQISSDTQLTGATLQVTSEKGVVTLTGIVGSDAARLDAYKIAAQTPGVARVVDQMSVQTSTPAVRTDRRVDMATNAAAAKSQTPKPDNSARQRDKKTASANDDQAAANASDAPAANSTAIPAPAVASAPAPTGRDLPAMASLAPPPPPGATVAAAPAIPQPKDVLIPANTTMSVLMIDGVDSSVNHTGEIFHASLDSPIVISNEVVVPKGADVYVRLASASQAGKLHGKSELTLELVKLEFQGQSYSLESSSYAVTGASQNKSTAQKVGAGAVIGSIIGAVVGRGKGAAIGAAAGAGAGGIYQGSQKAKQVKVPSETRLDFLLDQPVTVTVMPHAAATD